MFYYLLNNPNRIVSTGELINYTWDENAFIFTETVYVCISRIRNKIKDCKNTRIITIHGKGYMLFTIATHT